MANVTKLNESETTARATLRGLLPVDGKVYVIIRHVSRSRELRRMDLYAMRGGEPFLLNGTIRDALGWKLDRDGRIPVHGNGMNMSEHVVHALGRGLYDDGYALGCRVL